MKPQLSKLKFAFGKSLFIEKGYDVKKFIPEDYQAVFILQADFELAWAWMYDKGITEGIESALKKARVERKNIPFILKLSEQFNIPITWLTVGHLFLESCVKTNDKAHINLPRLPFFESEFWNFTHGDWFQYDPCSNEKDAPEWYCPDLIYLIKNSKIEQEIGCHTFAHINCHDEICPPEVMEADLHECRKAAEKYDIKLKSFVHPAHTIGNIEILEKFGYLSYRTDYKYTLGVPERKIGKLWELKTSSPLYRRQGWSDKYHIYRYMKIIDKALQNNSVCVMWFHPSEDYLFFKNILSELMKYIDSKRNSIYITTAQNYMNWLNLKF